MSLTRPRHRLPENILRALMERNLLDAYHARPDYQQNDYIGWITRAKREATKQKRLMQMLEELEGGDRYMKMRWRPSR